MEIPNLGKLYQTFLDNERKMAEAYGVSHLYYLKRINENQFPFSLLPGVTTLATCIRSLEHTLMETMKSRYLPKKHFTRLLHSSKKPINSLRLT